MKTSLTRLIVFGFAVFIAGLLRGQSPTPFGTPSLLPIRDHYASWHAESLSAPSDSSTVENPSARGKLPGFSPLSSLSRLPPALSEQPAGVRRPIPAVLDMQQQLPSVMQPRVPPVQPRAPTESVAPGLAGPDPLLHGHSGIVGDYGYGSSCEPYCEGVCDPCCDPCCEPCLPCFYASVGGLLFTRNRHRFRQISFDTTDIVGQVLSTHSTMGRWDWGGMATVGWIVNPCSGCALELGYWGVFGSQVESTVYTADIPGDLNTVFDLRPLNIGATNVNDLFDDALAHRIRRDYDVHSAEVNLVGGRFPGMVGGGFQFSYLGGFRYLRSADDFYYASADANPVFGVDPANEAYYEITVRNNLMGFQLGGRADWFVTPRFSLYAAPKFGIYANYMEHRSRIYNAFGTAVVGPGNPLVGAVYDIASDKTVTSFMGEIDLGVNYQFTHCLSAGIGYRALAISGLAYATDQIPNHFADIPGVAMIDSSAHMILHGGYVSATLTW